MVSIKNGARRPITSPAIYILIIRCLCKCGEPKSGKISFMFIHMWPSCSPYNRIIQTWSRYDNVKIFHFHMFKRWIFNVGEWKKSSVGVYTKRRKSFSLWQCKCFNKFVFWLEEQQDVKWNMKCLLKHYNLRAAILKRCSNRQMKMHSCSVQIVWHGKSFRFMVRFKISWN